MGKIITQEQVDRLIEDVSYMQDEAEALKYVIDFIPYGKQPLEGQSIAEILTFIDSVQKFYYQYYLQKAVEKQPLSRIDRLDQFIETFDVAEKNAEDIQSLLDRLAKHRIKLINTIKNISVFEWSTSVYVGEKKMTLFEFIQQIVHFDRGQLKKIAGLVRVFGEQKQTERRIK